jgi:hypothetical protein
MIAKVNITDNPIWDENVRNKKIKWVENETTTLKRVTKEKINIRKESTIIIIKKNSWLTT